MVPHRKDSSLEIHVRFMVSIAITSIITLVLLPQLVLYKAQQYRQGSREVKSLYRGVELLSRNHTSAFVGRENHLGHKNVLCIEKPLNFLHPLSNYRQTMKDVEETMPVLERFVVLMSDHTSRSQGVNDARNVLSICAEGKNA